MALFKNPGELQHLCWRAGFGPDASLLRPAPVSGEEALFLQLSGAGAPAPAAITVPETEALLRQYEALLSRRQKPSAEMRKALRRQEVRGLRKLNLAWIERMVATPYPLQEKMALFWHGHFACRVNSVVQQQQLLGVIRKHALGSFRTLLTEVSKSPAMLQFLNNQQNRKRHPNENFGREVMELFTMGRGHYTEDDVKEGSRAFTGWGYTRRGEFTFRAAAHDEGSKTFLGRTGRFTGDDILDMLLEQKATARHITEKIYRYFVNDAPDPGHVDALAERFYPDYDIAALMQTMLRADWFYDAANRGNRIKSPVELLVGMRRAVPVRFGKPEAQLVFQRLMDQVLCHPPNVAGWPGGRSWIDSSTLLFRMRLPQIIYAAGAVSARPKDMPDEMAYAPGDRNPYLRGMAGKVEAVPEWERLATTFSGLADAELPRALAEVLLARDPAPDTLALLARHAGHGSRGEQLRHLTIALMSTPEYQLC